MFGRRPPDHYLVLGLPKTGTSALFYAIDQALRRRRASPLQKLLTPRIQRFFEPKPDTLPPLKRGRTVISKVLWEHFDDDALRHYLDHGAGTTGFTRRVAITRDPRDQFVSEVLYMPYVLLTSLQRWDDLPALRQWVTLLQQKETHPASISLVELARALPGSTDGGQAAMSQRHLAYGHFIHDPRHAFHICQYERFVAADNHALSQYLGLTVVNDTGNPNIPVQVKRSTTSGHWRQWFTQKDVELLKPELDEALAAYGYDASDWRLAPQPDLDPAHGSRYVTALLNRALNKRAKR